MKCQTLTCGSNMQTCKNKLTAISNRDMFDNVPGGVTNPFDVKRWHDFRDKYHRAEQLECVSDFPLQIDFELNSTCQMKCGFCVHGQGKVSKKLLGFDKFKRVIDEGAKYGLCSIKLNYVNEPLLLPDLTKYIDYARSKGVLNVYFATNGLLLNEVWARRLIDAKVSKVMVSLDAATPETFEKMRHSARFSTIVANIIKLIKLRDDMGLDYPLVRVNFLKTEVNAHEADEFVEQWSDVADMVAHQELMNIPGTTEVTRKEIPSCVLPFKTVAIDASGAILPCCGFVARSMPIGNIDNSTVAEAWNGAKIKELRSLHKNNKGATNPICAHCLGHNDTTVSSHIAATENDQR